MCAQFYGWKDIYNEHWEFPKSEFQETLGTRILPEIEYLFIFV